MFYVSEPFKRAHHIQNTVEHFRVVKVNISHISVTHNISELDYDKEIEGIFYHEELIPTLDSGNYIITALKSRKKKNLILSKRENFPNPT